MIDESWKPFLATEFAKPYFKQLSEFTLRERQTQTIYPSHEDVFNAFEVPYEGVKVVILGQDPYHGSGQAHGLCFSVKPGVAPPPSLKNIFQEMRTDLGLAPPNHGCLSAWTKQGVFLLNATLTVRANSPGSHQNQGWETFTDNVIRQLGVREKPIVFILWGKYAQAKRLLIDEEKHTVLSAAHPSPMSASNGFFGSKPFSKANYALKQAGLSEIDWKL